MTTRYISVFNAFIYYHYVHLAYRSNFYFLI